MCAFSCIIYVSKSDIDAPDAFYPYPSGDWHKNL